MAVVYRSVKKYNFIPTNVMSVYCSPARKPDKDAYYYHDNDERCSQIDMSVVISRLI